MQAVKQSLGRTRQRQCKTLQALSWLRALYDIVSKGAGMLLVSAPLLNDDS